MPENISSPASKYFDQWTASPKSAFDEIIAQIGNNETDLKESTWLDYKEDSPLWFENGGAAVTEHSRKEKIKETLGEYLSGFSNTSGGLLIFGIKAPSGYPTKKSFAEDAVLLADICERVHLAVCDPPVLGVRILPLPYGENGKGLVVVFVPESQHRPHRSMVRPERTYFMRVKDSCEPISTSMLRAMFYPQITPSCFPIARLYINETFGEKTLRYHYILAIPALLLHPSFGLALLLPVV